MDFKSFIVSEKQKIRTQRINRLLTWLKTVINFIKEKIMVILLFSFISTGLAPFSYLCTNLLLQGDSLLRLGIFNISSISCLLYYEFMFKCLPNNKHTISTFSHAVVSKLMIWFGVLFFLHVYGEFIIYFLYSILKN